MLDKNILIGGRFKSDRIIFAIDVADVQALSPRPALKAGEQFSRLTLPTFKRCRRDPL